MPKGKWKEYFDEEVRGIVNEYLSGTSAKVLANRLGCQNQRITRWVAKLGFHVRSYKESRELEAAQNLAKVIGRTEKRCKECRKVYPIEAFYLNSNFTDGRLNICKWCMSTKSKENYLENCEEIKQDRRNFRKQHPRKQREYDLKKKFKIGFSELEVMLEAQGGVCAGCGTTESGQKSGEWHVDHDHACCPHRRDGRTCGNCIRGILCRACNLTLGNAKDDPERLRRLATYLDNYERNKLISEGLRTIRPSGPDAERIAIGRVPSHY